MKLYGLLKGRLFSSSRSLTQMFPQLRHDGCVCTARLVYSFYLFSIDWILLPSGASCLNMATPSFAHVAVVASLSQRQMVAVRRGRLPGYDLLLRVSLSISLISPKRSMRRCQTLMVSPVSQLSPVVTSARRCSAMLGDAQRCSASLFPLRPATFLNSVL